MSMVEELLERALGEVRSGVDATATIALALAKHAVLLGELASEEVDEGEPPCICPPGMVERGGFRGGCPHHRG